MMRQTHTYVIMEISRRSYNEIERLLKDAGYEHAFMQNEEIDMHGIAITPKEDADAPRCEICSAQCDENCAGPSLESCPRFNAVNGRLA